MLERAVRALEQNARSACAAFNRPTGGFRNGELYVFSTWRAEDHGAPLAGWPGAGWERPGRRARLPKRFGRGVGYSPSLSGGQGK
jgi:hypothetical protein